MVHLNPSPHAVQLQHVLLHDAASFFVGPLFTQSWLGSRFFSPAMLLCKHFLVLDLDYYFCWSHHQTRPPPSQVSHVRWGGPANQQALHAAHVCVRVEVRLKSWSRKGWVGSDGALVAQLPHRNVSPGNVRTTLSVWLPASCLKQFNRLGIASGTLPIRFRINGSRILLCQDPNASYCHQPVFLHSFHQVSFFWPFFFQSIVHQHLELMKKMHVGCLLSYALRQEDKSLPNCAYIQPQIDNLCSKKTAAHKSLVHSLTVNLPSGPEC